MASGMFIPSYNFSNGLREQNIDLKTFNSWDDITKANWMISNKNILSDLDYKGLFQQYPNLQNTISGLTNNLSTPKSISPLSASQETIMPSISNSHKDSNTLIKDDVISKSIPHTFGSQKYQDKWLEADTLAKDAERGIGITNAFMGSLGTATNMGLGIWQAIENKNYIDNVLTPYYDKQNALAQEQIDASQELRQQRQKEIDRLKRVRSNTNQRFNSSAIVSRSY